MKYRKKPVVVEARQIRGYTELLGPDGIAAWCDGVVCQDERGAAYLIVPTPEGTMRARISDWIIRGVAGEFYPCRDDIFRATHEPVEEQER